MTNSKSDLGLILRAAAFATHKHKDQRRKVARATPYINHPISLAEVLHTDGGVRDPSGELTDTKFLGKEARKRLQVVKAGKARMRKSR